MTEKPLNVAVIVGSTREGRFGGTVARWFAEQVDSRSDMVLDLIDLAEIELPAALGTEKADTVAAYADRIDRADAFVILTPEYNHGYPASLKQAIDVAKAQWYGKPVGFVSYGGAAGGIRAVEQLRQVFPEVHALTIRDAVSFHMVWEKFDSDGNLVDREGPNSTAQFMLSELAWWGVALRDAKAKTPYLVA